MKEKNIVKSMSEYTCPNCGEKHNFYLDENKKEKGILAGEYFFEGFFDSNYGSHYECFSCGHKWDVRKNKKPLSIKLFPFLENK